MAHDFYRRALVVLQEEKIPFLVGGSYAVFVHTGIRRATKDFDLFVMPEDLGHALDAFGRAGYGTELTFPHWLGKVFEGPEVVDIIFNSGNGVCRVDERWFEFAIGADVLGLPMQVCPAEETIWQKAFIMERERFDGADVIHIIRARGASLDWARLLERFGEHWQVLLAHLVLLDFVYPGERDLVPEAVFGELCQRLSADRVARPPGAGQCRGTLLSRVSYEVDVACWGYDDARRHLPHPMSPEDIGRWSHAAD
jgi:hypothetical protein